jgi:hypothetical protein
VERAVFIADILLTHMMHGEEFRERTYLGTWAFFLVVASVHKYVVFSGVAVEINVHTHFADPSLLEHEVLESEDSVVKTLDLLA